MIYLSPPEDFEPRFETVGAFVIHKGKFLLLHRQEHKPQGGTWGVPAGKIDAGETKQETMLRELFEETGITVQIDMLQYDQSLFVRFPEYDFLYHIFAVHLSEIPSVVLQPKEHQAFRWVAPAQASHMNLMPDLDRCIELYFHFR